MKRLIPEASNSIKFRVLEKRKDTNLDAPKLLKEKVVSRPPVGTITEVILEGLPAVDVSVEITAQDSGDGSGTAQAKASVELKVTEAATVRKSVTLSSTITQLKINPQTPTTQVGQSVLLTATAYNASDDVVLTSPNKWQWAVADRTVADGNPNGYEIRLGGAIIGETEVTAFEQESGKQVKVTVKVGPDALNELLGSYLGTATFSTADGTTRTQIERWGLSPNTVGFNAGTFNFTRSTLNPTQFDDSAFINGIPSGNVTPPSFAADSGDTPVSRQVTGQVNKRADGSLFLTGTFTDNLKGYTVTLSGDKL